ncbi:hypothetical protein FRC19_001182 [Serendipita sp. 401]|nr:hypothetical protein FRC19_001182 [Serendipita sp. 401]
MDPPHRPRRPPPGSILSTDNEKNTHDTLTITYHLSLISVYQTSNLLSQSPPIPHPRQRPPPSQFIRLPMNRDIDVKIK